MNNLLVDITSHLCMNLSICLILFFFVVLIYLPIYLSPDSLLLYFYLLSYLSVYLFFLVVKDIVDLCGYFGLCMSGRVVCLEKITFGLREDFSNLSGSEVILGHPEFTKGQEVTRFPAMVNNIICGARTSSRISRIWHIAVPFEKELVQWGR